ncbi:cathepsin L-like proteinase [Anthonomus grandis grandis]|uniref:cathepsin L-like proteinase n=1 Tax=Anthonomus grandis grandis TaxID=2921223 RepID=UPI002165452A|nr:cathepsin L-like proteinase [Anthonomus grandis grandis]
MWAKLALVIYLIIIVDGNSQEWKEFKAKHAKTYPTKTEEARRYKIFKSNVESIKEHNLKYERGEVTWYQAINHMSDWTVKEFRQLLGAMPYNHTKNEKFHVPSGVKVPSSIDWRDYGVVTEVQQQGSCGACWAFSVAGALEGLYAFRTGQLLQLSEQNLLDCATAANGYDCNGCSGGVPQSALQYVQDNGIDYYDEYPYEEIEDTCRQQPPVLQISGYTSTVQNDENNLLDAVGSVGPVSVCINCDLIMNYGGGVFQDSSCSQTINHAVLAVGYGSENGLNYWLMKNSWGTSWGIDGYIKMVMGQNMCGVASQPCYPYL